MSSAAAVFVAGRGVVSPLGFSLGEFSERLFAGESAILPRKRSAAWNVPTTVAGELPLHAWGAGQRVGDPLPLAENAARQALAEAGDPDPSTVALVLAS
ncbi:MAG: 3-oxoacyl-(acyl-carrier-protein) synthase, partial [Pseudohongiellaceae bacterium]